MDGNVGIALNLLHFATEPKSRYPELDTDQKRLTALHLGASYVLTNGKRVLKLNELLVPGRDDVREFETTASCPCGNNFALKQQKTGLQTCYFPSIKLGFPLGRNTNNCKAKEYAVSEVQSSAYGE
jgi:hypothetical protein